MVSEEKMNHLAHVVINAIWKSGMVELPSEEEARREAKKVFLQYLSHLNEASEVVAKRIRSQKNAPLEGSPQWEVLYQKYLEEEIAKRGG